MQPLATAHAAELSLRAACSWMPVSIHSIQEHGSDAEESIGVLSTDVVKCLKKSWVDFGHWQTRPLRHPEGIRTPLYSFTVFNCRSDLHTSAKVLFTDHVISIFVVVYHMTPEVICRHRDLGTSCQLFALHPSCYSCTVRPVPCSTRCLCANCACKLISLQILIGICLACTETACNAPAFLLHYVTA